MAYFATLHGKGACDGIGGSAKRSAYNSSLQRPYENQITTVEHLFEWASNFFKNITFDFCTKTYHEEELARLEDRFRKAKVIKNIRQFHCFIPQNVKTMQCKIFSAGTDFELKNLL